MHTVELFDSCFANVRGVAFGRRKKICSNRDWTRDSLPNKLRPLFARGALATTETVTTADRSCIADK